VPALPAVSYRLDKHLLFPEVCAKAGNGFIGQRIVSSPGRDETISEKSSTI
jgi:hypothetical protein